ASCRAASRSAWAAAIASSCLRWALDRVSASSSLARMKSRCRAVGSGALLGRTRHPRLCLGNIVPGQQPVRWTATPVPLDGALKIAGVLAQPLEVGVQRRDQLREAGAEARTRCCLGVRMEKDVVALSQLRWRAHALQRSLDNGKDSLAESLRLLRLPGADFG